MGGCAFIFMFWCAFTFKKVIVLGLEISWHHSCFFRNFLVLIYGTILWLCESLHWSCSSLKNRPIFWCGSEGSKYFVGSWLYNSLCSWIGTNYPVGVVMKSCLTKTRIVACDAGCGLHVAGLFRTVRRRISRSDISGWWVHRTQMMCLRRTISAMCQMP